MCVCLSTGQRDSRWTNSSTDRLLLDKYGFNFKVRKKPGMFYCPTAPVCCVLWQKWNRETTKLKATGNQVITDTSNKQSLQTATCADHALLKRRMSPSGVSESVCTRTPWIVVLPSMAQSPAFPIIPYFMTIFLQTNPQRPLSNRHFYLVISYQWRFYPRVLPADWPSSWQSIQTFIFKMGPSLLYKLPTCIQNALVCSLAPTPSKALLHPHGHSAEE